MKELQVVITDSGFGGMNILAETYEMLKNKIFDFPLTLSFVEALPKNCEGYPWQGYSLMPDKKTKIEVFNDVLTGIEKTFEPDIIAVACNTLSALLKETRFYAKNSNRLLNIIDIGLHPQKNMKTDKKSYVIILGTETTLSDNMHKKWLTENNVFEEGNIIPAVFDPASNYPLLIETDPFGRKTYELSYKVLKAATQKINIKEPVLYIYLACTHFAFVKDSYIKILNELGFEKVKIINPNTAMSTKILEYIESHNTVAGLPENKKYPIEVKIYSQFKLTEKQVFHGVELLNNVSPFVADKLKTYIFKNDIVKQIIKMGR